jgi:pimeloyl-ACP methyl ester carboxylesterase
MARIEVSGIGIEYELLGEAGRHAVAINPGGRISKEAAGVRAFGEALAAGGKRVLIWDRPNCGKSDLCLEGDNESALQGRVLTELIHALKLGPTAVTGGSAGSRTSLFAALHDPSAVSHVIPFWISGGTLQNLYLGGSYFATPAAVARMQGLPAVLDLPHWTFIRDDPRKREAFLKLNVEQFIAKMERWSETFMPSDDSPVPGMTPQDFAKLTVPILIIRGTKTDIFHPDYISDWVHKLLPHSKMVEPPWHDDAPFERMGDSVRSQGKICPFSDWKMLAPAILEFTSGES